jgi:Tat protein translocase TatB subunit
MFGSLGTSELLMILVVALIVFGPRKLPQLGRTIGESLAQFRRASEDFKRSWEQEVTIEEKQLTVSTPPANASQPVKKELAAEELDGQAPTTATATP